VILITDGSSGIGVGSLKQSLQTYNRRTSTEAAFSLPFAFPAKLHVLCVANLGDPDLKASLPLFQKLININNQVGVFYCVDSFLSLMDDVYRLHVSVS
jgi:hypothetical protein